jgi:hypothetical protein
VVGRCETKNPQIALKCIELRDTADFLHGLKHHNACIFDRAHYSASNLVNQIKDEAAAWVKVGAKGLRDVAPRTWDVH